MFSKFRHFNLLIVFSILLMLPVYSKNSKDNKAFYALCSLRSHLDISLSENNQDPNYFFSDDDISSLWSSAIKGNDSCKITLAMEKYYRAQSANPVDAKCHLIASRNLLADCWRQTNHYLKQNEMIEKGPEEYFDYLLPENNPLQKPLSQIFADPNVLKTPETFRKAGFQVISERPSGMLVASHPLLKGYLVKAYIESHKMKENWEWAVYRCLGVNLIRKLIKEKKLRHFVTPDKWIYPLTPFEKNGNLIENTTPIILVVTDMELVDKSDSKNAWKTSHDKILIQQLYCILSHGYSSCCLGSNIPYTLKGKYACIDTENPQRDLPLHHVGRHLSEEMSLYWEYLVRTGGRGSPYR